MLEPEWHMCSMDKVTRANNKGPFARHLKLISKSSQLKLIPSHANHTGAQLSQYRLRSETHNNNENKIIYYRYEYINGWLCFDCIDSMVESIDIVANYVDCFREKLYETELDFGDDINVRKQKESYI